MSDAIKKLHDYLAKSPSVVYPEDVLAYLPAIEDENAELRKLASDMRWCLNDKCSWCQKFGTSCSTERNRQKLGIEAP